MKKNKKLGLEVKNVSTEASTAELYIYGEIVDDAWWDGEVSPAVIAEALEGLEGVKNIDMYVNSPGGGVFAGMAIYNILNRLDAHIKGHVDGVAASIASVVLMVADEIIMPENALIMIHDPLLFLYGYYNAADMDKLSTDLEPFKDIIAAVYEARSTLEGAAIRDLMAAETFITADKALEYGIISEVGALKTIEAVENKGKKVINGVEFAVDRYKNFPANFAEPKQVEDPAATPEPVVIDHSLLENEVALYKTF